MSDITNRLRELAHAVAKQRWSEFSMRVPADHDRDADLVLVRAADEITQLRAENARLIGDHAAALRLVTDVRAVIGDDGRRMQPELIEYCKAMKRDAERYRWLRNDSGDDFETPWIALGMHGNEWLTGEHADAAIDAANGGGNG